jgi:hypothetical protein
VLRWKQTQLLLGRALLLTEYRTTLKSASPKAVSNKIDISPIGLLCAYRYIAYVATCAGLFREMVSINYRNVMEIVTVVIEKTAMLIFEARLKDAFSWSWNVHIHRPLKVRNMNETHPSTGA